MLAILEVLFRISNANQGLATTTMSRHYLWVYGPTAILTVFLALWNRVDYRIRQMTPWSAFPQGRITPGHHGLFKNYLSPTTPEILWQSIKNRDVNVTVSSLVLNLITLLIIMSTSLFVLETRPTYRGEQIYQVDLRLLTDIVQPTVPNLAMDIIDAIDTMELPYPWGTTPDLAFEPFHPTNDTRVGDFQQAMVNVFTVDLQCQETELAVLNWTYSWLPCYETISGNTPYETVSLAMSITNCTIYPWVMYGYFEDGHIGKFAFYGDICSDYAVGFAVGVGEAKQVGTAGPVPQPGNCSSGRPYARVEVLRSKQWICQPYGSIRKGNVTFNATNLKLGALPNITIDHDAQPISLGTDLATNLWQAPNEIDPSPSFHAGIPSLLQPLTVGVLRTYNNLERILRPATNSTIDDLFGSNLLLTLTQNYYTRLLVQVVHSAMMEVSDQTVLGMTIANESRLVLRGFTVRFMEGCLAALVVLIVFLAFRYLKDTMALPDDPSRLMGLILLLQSQPQIMSAFANTGHRSEDDLRKKVGVRSGQEPLTVQHVIQDCNRDRPSMAEARPGVVWWQPLPIARGSRLGVIILVIAVIIALQVLLAYARRLRGLVNISLSGDQHLVWSIIPAAVMTNIAIYFRALGSTYKTFAPYFQLRTDLSEKSRKSLLLNYLTATEPEVIYYSLRTRQWAVTFMSFAAVLSTFLTILVSGIWSPEPVPDTREVNVTATSSFNKSSTDDGRTGNNAFIAGLVLGANLSYPQWTYGNLALTSIGMDAGISQSISDDDRTTLEVDLPALRSLLNCTIYTESQIPDLAFYPTYDGYGTHGDPTPHGMFLKMPGPKSCAGNSTVSFTPGLGDSIPSWQAYFTNTISGCPTWNYFWGRQEAPTDPEYDTAYNATFARALSCYEAIEQVQVATTLNLPSLKINTDYPPQIHSNSTNSIFSDDLIKYPYAILPEIYSANSSGLGFWAILNYTSGLVGSDFGNPEKVDEIVDAIKSAHGVIRAQQYHAALRNPVDTKFAPANTIVARLVMPNRYRLMQNAVTTHVLCAVLAIMITCVGLASWFMSTGYVLPKNPCSIAASISLLADSNMFADHALMQALEDELRGRGNGSTETLQGVRFQMGWFHTKSSAQRVFTVNAIDSDHEARRRQSRRNSSVSLQSLLPPVDTGRPFSSGISPGDGGEIIDRG